MYHSRLARVRKGAGFVHPRARTNDQHHQDTHREEVNDVETIITEQIAGTLPTSALIDSDRHAAASPRPGAAGELRRLRQGNGYLPVRRMPATWRGFTGGVCAVPAVAIRKHAPARGLSTWSPPV